MATLREQAEAAGITVDNRWSDETIQRKLDEANAGREPVDASNAKIIPNIGQPRAQSSEEIRLEKQDAETGVSKYPEEDARAAHARAVTNSKRSMYLSEFDTDDIGGLTVGGETEGQGTVVVRLLYDWWDGQGNRHAANNMVELPLNEAKNLVDQRKAERTDPMRGESSQDKAKAFRNAPTETDTYVPDPAFPPGPDPVPKHKKAK